MNTASDHQQQQQQQPSMCEQHWYCFMVVKRPKEPQNPREISLAQARLSDVGFEDEVVPLLDSGDGNPNNNNSFGIEDQHTAANKNEVDGVAIRRKDSIGNNEQRAGAAEGNDSEDDEEADDDNDDDDGANGEEEDNDHSRQEAKAASRAKKQKRNSGVTTEEIDGKKSKIKKKPRRKQDRRTAIHISQDPFEYVRKLNREPVLSTMASLQRHHQNHSQPLPPREQQHQQRPLSKIGVNGKGALTSEKKTPRGKTATVNSASGSPMMQTQHPEGVELQLAETLSASGTSVSASNNNIDSAPGDAAAAAPTAVTPRRKRKSFSYQVVSIIGPCLDQDQARVIEVIWNFKSRAVAPRMVLASVIAEQFRIKAWHDIQCMFALKYFYLAQMGDVVYLRLRRSKKSTAIAMTNHVEQLTSGSAPRVQTQNPDSAAAAAASVGAH